MSVKKIPASTAEELTRPVWLRAIITVAFAVVAIFWQQETVTLLKVSLAAFFVFGATAVWDYAKVASVPQTLRGALALGAAAWVVSGVTVIFVSTTTAAAVVAAIGFGAMGLAELIGGLRARREFVPARDQIILGAVGVLTGLGLAVGLHLDAHGILGMAGTGVIIMAVLLLISGAGLLHDARRGRARTS